MFQNPLFYCIAASLCFGSWPVIAKLGKVEGAWFAPIVCLGALIVATTYALVTTRGEGLVLSRGALIVGFAGLINGIGFLFFSRVVNWKDLDVTTYLSIIFALMPVSTMLAMMLLMHQPLTMKSLLCVIGAGTLAWYANS